MRKAHPTKMIGLGILGWWVRTNKVLSAGLIWTKRVDTVSRSSGHPQRNSERADASPTTLLTPAPDALVWLAPLPQGGG